MIKAQASVLGHDFKLLLTGPKFFDILAQKGDVGPINLVMCLLRLNCKARNSLLGLCGF